MEEKIRQLNEKKNILFVYRQVPFRVKKYINGTYTIRPETTDNPVYIKQKINRIKELTDIIEENFKFS